MKLRIVSVIPAILLASLSGRADEVWPGRDWAPAEPAEVGLDAEKLALASAHAERHGGGSGCIIRQGRLVTEWGSSTARADIKSATKGSVGTTLLGLALDAGWVKLDDKARRHYPALGTEKPENIGTGWLDEITVHQLATMTAGFDDGRPPGLVRGPGTGGEYSNDTSNMLAELLTLGFKEDLSEVFRQRVMEPIGAAPSEWKWRANSYRKKTIGELPSREFASGITITHRALARIGYLYLREGEWNGQRILSKEFIRLATRPTTLAAPFDYYAFYWGSNGKGTYPEIPRDAYWALGLGDSFVLVCPSLDIVAVRLGVGSNASRLPGDDTDANWGQRVAGFFRLVTAAVKDAPDPAPAARRSASLHAPSPVIEAIRWAPRGTIVRKARGSDNWPITWADDGALYAAYGDGKGFEPFVAEKLSLGLSRILGGPSDFTGVNLRAPTLETRGDGKSGKKASGVLCVDGVLWLWARNAGNSQLAWSADHGATWSWCDWKLTESFGCPTFLNYGSNYSGARDNFVYVYSPDAGDAYTPAGRMVLARVPRGRIRKRDAYEFFVTRDAGDHPEWTRDISRRGAVFESPGRCGRSGVTWCAPLRRCLWVQVLPTASSRDDAGRLDTRFAGGLAVYDAPEPWGPWTTAYFSEDWDVGPGDTASFPTKWMSADGKTLHLVFSGEDAFSVRKAELVLR